MATPLKDISGDFTSPGAPQDISENFAPPESAQPVSGLSYVANRALAGGYGAIRGAGAALQGTSEMANAEPGMLAKAGKAMEEYAAPKEQAAIAASPEAGQGNLAKGAGMIAQQTLGIAPLAVAGATGAAIPLPGTSEAGMGAEAAAQTFHEELQAYKKAHPDAPDAEARDHAWKSAGLSGATMAAFGGFGKLAGVLGEGVATMFGKAAPTALEAATGVTSKATLPTFAKEGGKMLAANQITGAIQQGGQAAINNQDQMGNGQTPMEAIAAGAGETAAGGLAFLPMAFLHARSTVEQSKSISNALSDPDAKAGDRSIAAQAVVNAVKKVDPDTANTFRDYADAQIKDGKPIEINPEMFKGKEQAEKSATPAEPTGTPEEQSAAAIEELRKASAEHMHDEATQEKQANSPLETAAQEVKGAPEPEAPKLWELDSGTPDASHATQDQIDERIAQFPPEDQPSERAKLMEDARPVDEHGNYTGEALTGDALFKHVDDMQNKPAGGTLEAAAEVSQHKEPKTVAEHKELAESNAPDAMKEASQAIVDKAEEKAKAEKQATKEQKAKAKEKKNAIQEPSTSGVLQHPQGGAGEAGSERGRVEQGKQRKEPAKKSEARAEAGSNKEAELSKAKGNAGVIEKVNKSLKHMFPGMDVKAVEASNKEVKSSVPDKSLKVASAIAKVFGKKIIFVKSEGKEALPFRGALNNSDPNRIIIALPHGVEKYDNERVMPSVVGHEIGHALRQQAGDLYKALESTIKDNFDIRKTADKLISRGYTDKAFDEALAGLRDDVKNKSITAHQFVERLKEEKEALWERDAGFREEAIADMIGDHMTDQKFWTDLSDNLPPEKAQNIFQKILDTLKKVLDAFKSEPTAYGSEKLLDDLQAAHDAVVKTMTEYKSRIDTGKIKGLSKDEQLKLSMKEGEANRSFMRLTPEMKKQARDLMPKLMRYAKEGKAAKEWYENSAKEILKAFGGDKAMAEKFIRVIAMTSPNSEVATNTTFALKAWEQYLKGEPFKVGTDIVNNALTDSLYFGRAWSGIKTNTFYVNLHEAMLGKDTGFSTQDMHMGRLAFGNEQPTENQYHILEHAMRLMAKRLGVLPRQAQAMVWVTEKTRHLMEQWAKKGEHKKLTTEEKYDKAMDRALHDYGTYLVERKITKLDANEITRITDEARANATHTAFVEAVPSESTPEGKAAGKLNQVLKKEFTNAVFKAVPPDEVAAHVLNRSDVEVRAIGSTGGYQPEGADKGKITPNIMVNLVSRTGEPITLEEVTRVADALNYVYTQDGVPVSRYDVKLADELETNKNVKAVARFELEAGAKGKVTQGNEAEFYRKLEAVYGVGIGYSKTSNVHITVGNFTNLTHDEFLKKAGELAKEAGVKVEGTTSESYYAEHNWSKDVQGTLHRARNPDDSGGRPDTQKRLADWRDKALQAGRDWLTGNEVKFDRATPNATSSELNGRVPEKENGLTARGVHYSREQRSELSSSSFGTGIKGEEAARVNEADDPRLKHRIYFYINGGKGINPEAGVGAHAHEADLKNIYDADTDNKNLFVKGDANKSESNILDAGYNGYMSRERGIGVMLGKRTMPVEYKGAGVKPEVPEAGKVEPTPYMKDLQSVAMNKSLPSGQMSGAEWKKTMAKAMPDIDVSHLNDKQEYYKSQIVQKPEMKLSRTQVETPEFKKWFGESKMVDEEGKPEAFYHGTASDIAEFKAKQAGAIFVTKKPGFAESFGHSSHSWMVKHAEEILSPEDLQAATLEAMNKIDKIKDVKERKARYADLKNSDEYFKAVGDRMPSRENIMKLYVKAEKPFDYENPAHVKELVGVGEGTRSAIASGDWGTIESRAIQARIKEAGFDGFYVKEGGEKNLAVYDPKQLKSAIGNSGAFDPEQADLRLSRKETERWAEHAHNNIPDTPDVLLIHKPAGALNKGGIYRPVIMNYEHVRHILNKHGNEGITAADIGALPESLQRPRAIIKQGEGAFAAIVDGRDKKGDPHLVALNNGVFKSGKDALKITEVSTLRGKEESASYLAKNLLDGKVTYLANRELANVKSMMESTKSTKPTKEVMVDSDAGKVKVNVPTDAPERLSAAGTKFSNKSKMVKQDAVAATESFGDKVKEFVGKVKDSFNEIKDAYSKYPAFTEVKRIIGSYTGALQRIDFELSKFAKKLNAEIPHDRQIAITNYIQAGGDESILRDRASKSKDAFKKGYQDALTLTDHEKKVADNIRDTQEKFWKQAHDAGILESYVENYVRGQWERETPDGKRIMAMVNSGVLNDKPKEAMQKLFQNYFEGEQAGYVPTDKRIGYQFVAAQRSIRHAIEARKALTDLLKSKEEDGRPTVSIGGGGSPLQDVSKAITDAQAALKAAKDKLATNPSSKAFKSAVDTARDALDAAVKKDEEDFKSKPFFVRPNTKGSEAADYKEIDHPSLRQWKWVGKDTAGSPILMQGTMHIHPDAYDRLNAILGKSAVREYTIPRSVPLIGGTRPGDAMLKAGGFIKSTMLVGVFHQFHLAEHAVFHGVNPFNTPAIDFAKRPLLMEGVNHGLMLYSHDAMHEFAEGLSGGGLLSKIPGVGDVLQRYQEYLFQDLIPRLKAQMYEKAVERAEAVYAKDIAAGKFTRDQLLDNAAKQANAAFGELNYKYMGRNRTVQDLLRIGLLAPDFLEARFKFAGQALVPKGREQMTALIRAAVIMSAGAQTINMMFGDDKKMHWDKPFSAIIGGREYSPRSVVGDIAHLITDPRGFWYNRVNPLFGKPLIELTSGRDQRGQKEDLTTGMENIIKSWTPLPAQGALKDNQGQTQIQAITSGLLGSIGVTNFKSKSEAEQVASDISYGHSPQQAKTGEQKDQYKQFTDLRNAYVSGELNSLDDVRAKAKENGMILSKSQIQQLQDARQETPEGKAKVLVHRIKNFTPDEMLKVWDKANDVERIAIRPEIIKKIARDRNMKPADKQAAIETVRQ